MGTSLIQTCERRPPVGNKPAGSRRSHGGAAWDILPPTKEPGVKKMGHPEDLRLIEAGFPCHQVGAETQRERGASSALPPLYFLHVWWARRPLTPSRAAIVASLDPAGTDPETFVRQLGIERVQALVNGEPWTLTGKLLERIEERDGGEVLPVDAVVLRAFQQEQERRHTNLSLIERLRIEKPELRRDPAIRRWEVENKALPSPEPEAGDFLPVRRIAGDPAWAKERIELENSQRIRTPEDKYQYPRAYKHNVTYCLSSFTVLDPTAGGGSIPFEALRLGHKVIANELNPVATVILHGTIDYPARFGKALADDIQLWGDRLLADMRGQIRDLFPPTPIDEPHFSRMQNVFSENGEEKKRFCNEGVQPAFRYLFQISQLG
jgi:putative DNA methylase